MTKTFIEILFSVEFEINENIVKQYFYFEKKYKKYLYNPSYQFFDKIKDKLKQYSLQNENISFLEKIEEENFILLIYEKSENDIIDNSKKMFKIVDYIPNNCGCKFCIYKKNLTEDFFYCNFKERTMSRELKTCRYFKQKNLYGNK